MVSVDKGRLPFTELDDAGLIVTILLKTDEDPYVHKYGPVTELGTRWIPLRIKQALAHRDLVESDSDSAIRPGLQGSASHQLPHCTWRLCCFEFKTLDCLLDFFQLQQSEFSHSSQAWCKYYKRSCLLQQFFFFNSSSTF
jgi:hypothetical protein